MKILSLTLLVLLSVNINSCKSKKTTTNAESKVETKIETMNKYIEDGYSKATVVFDKSKDEPCSYLIQLEKGALLEPHKVLSDKFKSNNKTVWIKFIRQRRMSRCGNAQPVELLEMIVR